MKAAAPNVLARAVHGFFGEYVPELRGLSRHTLLSYRDTLALLLRFLAESRDSDPAALDLEAISPQAVLEFLNHLERERHNKTSSRNVRLAAIHAFFRYVAIHTPERIEQAQRILAIPSSAPGPGPSIISTTTKSAPYSPVSIELHAKAVAITRYWRCCSTAARGFRRS
jgi:site-specific recombinase XerD